MSSSSSAFQPINSIPNILQKQSTIRPAPVLMDIPQHKALERGQQLHRVHISHPQSPSIVHVNLHFYFCSSRQITFSSLCYMKISMQLVVFFVKWQHIQNFNLVMHQLVLLSENFDIFFCKKKFFKLDYLPEFK